MNSGPTEPRERGRELWLPLAWATTLLLLLSVTWPLWTPLRLVPRLPPLAILATLPPAIDFLLLGLLVAGIARAVGAKQQTGLATVALAGLMLLDQLRWQPWAYHALLTGLVLTLCGPQRARRLLRWLTASVYLYAAVAKLDTTFAQTLGQQFLSSLLRLIGLSSEAWSPAVRTGAAFAFPLGELLLGLLLLSSLGWPRLARYGCFAALLLHSVTIGALGPWGLDHRLGVLLWNVGFACQTVVLYWPQEERKTGTPRKRSEWLAWAIVLLAILLPATNSLGGWDRWPSWGLYAPAGERTALFVHQSVADRIPVASKEDDTPWQRLRLDRWVLAETGAPVYPQNRIALRLAVALAERYPLANRLRATVQGEANRWTGERTTRDLEGTDALREASLWFGQRAKAVWTE